MRNKQPATDVITKPSIEAFALPSELRRAQNFSSRTRPIIGLDLPPTPPPLRRSSAPPPLWGLDHDASPPVTMPETDFLIESRLGDQDPPLNLPACWREAPRSASRNRSRWHWSERSTGAFSGFAGGLLFVVPLVFMLGGNPAGAPPSLNGSGTINFSFAATSAYLEKLWRNAQPTAPANTASRVGADDTPPASTAPATAAAEAKADLAEGRIEAARDKLRAAASPESAHLWFLLAETYDPNLARPATTNADGRASLEQPASDTEFARFYYRRAMTHGVEAAGPRLQALTSDR
jgi:hypothetical protein